MKVSEIIKILEAKVLTGEDHLDLEVYSGLPRRPDE